MNRDRLRHLQGLVEELTDAVGHLFHRHDVWTTYAKRLTRLPEERSGEAVFHEWLTQNYTDAMAVGIRRVVFPGRGATTCLLELLKAVQHDANDLRLEEALAVYHSLDEAHLREHERWLTRRFFTAEKHLSHSAIGEDVQRLEHDDALRRIKIWADKRVAHAVPNADVQSVAFVDVDKALAVVSSVLDDYSELLTGSKMSSHTPVIQEHWESILDRMFSHRDEATGRDERG